MPSGFTKLQKFVGVNLTDSPTELADNELAWARNCWPTKLGYIGPRPVQSAIGTSAAGADFALVDRDNDSTLFNFVDSDGVHRVVLYATVNNGAFGTRAGKFFLGDNNFNFTQAIERPNDTGTKFEEFASQRPMGFAYNNELFIFLGVDVPGLVLGAGDLTLGTGGTPKFRALGSTWATFTGATGDQHKFLFGDVYKDVFALGGLPPPYESLVFFTEGVDSGGSPQPSWYSLLTSAKSAGMGFGDGDKLLALKTTPILGGAAAVEPYCLALKQRSVWMFQGDPPTTTDDGTLVVTPVMRREGLVAAGAVCTTPYGIAWCSGRNVWLMPPGQKPVPIGEDIAGFLVQLPQTPTGAWHLTYHDDVLYLNFPGPTSWTGVPPGGGTPQLLPTQQLWCDMRRYEKSGEVHWWGPEDVHASSMLSLDLPDGARQLLGVCPTIPGGVLTHQPFSLGDGDRDAPSTTALTDLTTWDGGQIPHPAFQHVRFREMDFGDDSLEKIIEGIEVVATWDKPVAVSSDPMGINLIADGGRKSETGDIEDPPLPTLGTSANPDVGTIRSDLHDASDVSTAFTGLTWGTAGIARQCQINLNSGDDIADVGTVHVEGTGFGGNPVSEDIDVSIPGNEPYISTEFFETITLVELSTPSGNAVDVWLEEGPLIRTTTQFNEDDLSSTGFILDRNTLDGILDVRLSETFLALMFFPPDGERFLCRMLQPELYEFFSVGTASHRRFTIKSVTPRVRVISRRPGGSYGG